MKKITLKALLMAAALGMGGNAWATETVLTPTGGVTTVNTSSSAVAYSAEATTWKINQGGISGGKIGRYAGPYCLVKFDASEITGTITDATLTFDYASSSNNTSYNVYLLGAADWDATTVVWSGLSDDAKSATATIASGTWSTKNVAGTITYTITDNVSKSLMGMAICCNTGREQTISNIKLTISHTTATVYTASFTETNGLTPTVTLYTDEDRKETINNGALLDNTTYYYTATLTGYHDSKGSFTVAGANPSVSFTMTAKSVFTYTKRAMFGSEVLNATLATGSAYEGETVTLTWSKYIKVGEQWYVATENTFRSSSTASATEDVAYTTANIADFYEMEKLTRSGGAYVTEESESYSGGLRLRLSKGSLYYTPALAGGVYTLSIPWENSNNNSNEVYVYTRSSEGDLSEKLATFTTVKGSGTFSATIIVPEGYSIAFNGNEGSSYNNNARMDYMTLVAYKETKTITAAGYATYYSPYALDFSSTGLTAYIATYNATDKEVSFSEVTSVPANTGILLKGAEGNYAIPVVASSNTDVAGNVFVGVTEDTEVDAGIFVLLNGAQGVGFYKTENAFTVGANTAYISVPSGVKARFIGVEEEDDATAITAIEATEAVNNGVIYNLSGQRVVKPLKGIYIQNGKKILVK